MPVTAEAVIRTLGHSPVTKFEGFENLVNDLCEDENRRRHPSVHRVVNRLIDDSVKSGKFDPEDSYGDIYHFNGLGQQDSWKQDPSVYSQIVWDGRVMN